MGKTAQAQSLGSFSAIFEPSPVASITFTRRRHEEFQLCGQTFMVIDGQLGNLKSVTLHDSSGQTGNITLIADREDRNSISFGKDKLVFVGGEEGRFKFKFEGPANRYELGPALDKSSLPKRI